MYVEEAQKSPIKICKAFHNSMELQAYACLDCKNSFFTNLVKENLSRDPNLIQGGQPLPSIAKVLARFNIGCPNDDKYGINIVSFTHTYITHFLIVCCVIFFWHNKMLGVINTHPYP